MSSAKFQKHTVKQCKISDKHILNSPTLKQIFLQEVFILSEQINGSCCSFSGFAPDTCDQLLTGRSLRR